MFLKHEANKDKRGSQYMLNRDEIKKIIPHREPMLMLDEILEMIPGKSIRAGLYLSPDLEYFKGHFPENPVMPGVLTVEAMAQAADVLLLSTERYAGTIPFFIGIDGVRFRKKIEPGDHIIIEASITQEREEKAIVTCDAVVYNKDEIATSGTVTLAMR